MNIAKLNSSPNSIILHEAGVIKFGINNDSIVLKLKIGESVFLWNEEVLKSIFQNPREKSLFLDLNFRGVKVDKLSLSSDFVLNEDISITNNDYDEETKIMTIGIEDSYNNYADISFSFEEFQWVYVDEK